MMIFVHFDLKLFDRAANNALYSSNSSVYHVWELLLQ